MTPVFKPFTVDVNNCFTITVADPGEGPGGTPPPPLIFRLNWGRKGRKNLISGSGWPPPPPHPYLKVWICHWINHILFCFIKDFRTFFATVLDNLGSISAISRDRSLILPSEGWVRAHFPEKRLVIEPMDNLFSKKNSEVRSPSLSGFSITMLHVFTSWGQFNNKFTSVIINSTHYLFSDWPRA